MKTLLAIFGGVLTLAIVVFIGDQIYLKHQQLKINRLEKYANCIDDSQNDSYRYRVCDSLFSVSEINYIRKRWPVYMLELIEEYKEYKRAK